MLPLPSKHITKSSKTARNKFQPQFLLFAFRSVLVFNNSKSSNFSHFFLPDFLERITRESP